MTKKYNRTLVAGKFIPPHKGHLALMDETVKVGEDHLIIICSTVDDKIDPQLRLEWLRILRPDYNVVVFPSDHLPQNTDADPKISKQWADAFFEEYGEFDAIVSSEKYGDTFAQAAGISHHMFDLERTAIPVSGSKIMAQPLKYWEFIPEEIRYYFTKKICVFGPESTGKSTLTETLGDTFNAPSVPEMARIWLGDRQPLESDFIVFGLYQAGAVLDAVNETYNGIVFSDTNAITTKVFLPEYFPNYQRNTLATLDMIDNALEYDFYVLLAPSVPWVDDGTRVLGKEDKRWELYDKYRSILVKRNLPFVEIKSTDWAERTSDAIQGVLNFIGGKYD